MPKHRRIAGALVPMLLGLLTAAALAQGSGSQITIEKDVVFVNGSRMAMDVARPDESGLRPAVVTIGGAGYRDVDRTQHEALIRKLAEHGYVAASISYRVGVRNPFPAPVQDAKAAVRFLRANAERFRLDPARICVLGESAGGAVALVTAMTPGVAEFDSGPSRELPSTVSCAVSLSGITDFTRAYATTATATAGYATFFGGDAENARRTHALASAINWTSPQAPPILAIQAAGDRSVPGAHASWLADRLRAAGATVEVETPAGAAHGLALLSDARIEAHVLSFLDRHLGVAVPTRTVIVSDHGGRRQIVAMEWPSGRELWTMPNAGGHDVQPLPNGHVLFTLGPEKRVVELDDEQRPIWTYGADEGLVHPISAERLANGNTLIGDAQLGQVIEVDKDRKIAWKYESADLGNMRMRNVRRTAAGTTLIAVEAAGKIIEVNRAGEIVWSYEGVGGATRRPYKAVRLASGNTVITFTDPGEVVEVDKTGKIVRAVGGQRPDLRLVWASGLDIFDNGNWFVSDYLGRRLLEIGPTGKVLHEVRMPTRTTASIAVVR